MYYQLFYLAVQAFADQLLQGLHLDLDTRREKTKRCKISTYRSAFAVIQTVFYKHGKNIV